MLCPVTALNSGILCTYFGYFDLLQSCEMVWPLSAYCRSGRVLTMSSVPNQSVLIQDIDMIVAVVEKSLKEVAEIKAQALAEAAEWKRKYEMEHLQCLHLENCALGLWIFPSKG
jgi:hypothetical protein